MITYLNKADAEQQMNALGAAAEPFLFVIDYNMERNVVLSLEQAREAGIQFQVSEGATSQMTTAQKIDFEFEPIPFETYEKAFDLVHSEILWGNSFLCNLTVESKVRTNLDLSSIYDLATAKYKLLMPNIFTCFSPETFIKIDNKGIISSFPMKGTISAEIPDAQNVLLQNQKELYEHHTIVDLIRNDVGIVAEKVWVPKFRYLEKIEKHDGTAIYQMSSEISGQLPVLWKSNVGSLLFKMLPAGSISGAPKKKTLEIIAAAEAHTYFGGERGFYTGVFGYFDGQTVDSAVMIRFVEQRDEQLFFKSGGGITFMSTAEEEYAEMLQKIYLPKS